MSSNSLLYVGVAISVGGNILVSVALNIQKYSHNKNEAADVKKSYLHRPLWWLGLILVLIGELGNFLGYAFAPASVIAPLGTLILVSNAIIAWVVLKEKFRFQDVFGIILAIGGAIVVVIFSASDKPPFDASELLDALKDVKFIVYLVVTVLLCIGLMVASWKLNHKYLIIDMLILGIYAGYTVISTKAIATFITQDIALMFTQWVFYVMLFVLIFTGAMQIRYLQMSLETHDATEVVPIQYTMLTIFAVTASGVLYDDFSTLPPKNIGLFVLGILLIFGGVYLLSHGRMKHKTVAKVIEEADIEAQEGQESKTEINANYNENEQDDQQPEQDLHDKTQLIAR